MLINDPGKWKRPVATALAVPKLEDFPEERRADYDAAYDAYLASNIKMLRMIVACDTWAEHPKRDANQNIMYDAKGQMLTELKPIHREAERCWGCRHLLDQLNDDQPKGGLVIYNGFYCCIPCYRLIQRCRFKYEKELVTTCHLCVQMLQKHINRIDPSLIIIARRGADTGLKGQGKG